MAKNRKLKEDNFGAKSPAAFGMLRPFPAKSKEAAKGAGALPKPASRFPSGTCFECGDAGHWGVKVSKAG